MSSTKKSSWTSTPERGTESRVVAIGSSRFTRLYGKLGARTLKNAGECVGQLSELNAALILVEEPEPPKLREFKWNHPIPIVVSAPGWLSGGSDFNRLSHPETCEPG